MSKKANDKTVVKRTVKDSVFSDLFGRSKYLLQLYRALHPEDTDATEDDLHNVTINNVLTDNQYNDLGFCVRNTLLILVEAQSTWSVNIIVRILLYLVQSYSDYFTDNDIDLYSSAKVDLPKSELYVIYTGNRKSHPKYISLKDTFFNGLDVAIEAKAKIIYDGQPDDIISQYILFSKICDEQIRLYGRTKEAITETLSICKNRSILWDYLKSREKEVFNLMVAFYDAEELAERHWRVKMKKVEQQVIREAKIEATVEAYQGLGASTTDTVGQLQSKFRLSTKNANKKVRKYWAQNAK